MPAHSFAARAERSADHPLKAYLYRLIASKKTNLCVSADVHSTAALLELAEQVGDHICVLKTHADIIDDFGERTIRRLTEISTRKRFLLFEDRKFGDIGNTVKAQYARGPFRIASWAHLVNAHIFPGPAIVDALWAGATETATALQTSVSTEIGTGTPHASEGEDDDDDAAVPLRRKGSVVATTTIRQTVSSSRPSSSTDLAADEAADVVAEPPPAARGLLLLAEMSSAGNRLDAAYTRACVEAARARPDFVLGFVAQRGLNERDGDEFVCMTPGVSLPREGAPVTGDGLGQQYRTPEAVVCGDGCDVVIVGRGILAAKDRAREAARYRAEAWKAYEKRLGKGA